MKKKFTGLFALLIIVASLTALAMGDALLSNNKALPNGAAIVDSDSFDLGLASPDQLWTHAYLKVEVPALSKHLTNTSSLSFILQDSSDNSTFTNMPVVMKATLAGLASTGTAATNYIFHIPKGVKRYIRIHSEVDTAIQSSSSSYFTNSIIVP